MMFKLMTALAILFALPLTATYGPGTCNAADKKEYLSQTTIDTLVQQAFVKLNASTASDVPDAEARRMQALIDAKKLVKRLRAASKGDPNRKYVLWKTGELENQVLLEEHDILLKKMQTGRQTENQRIDKFNNELAKSRPDFAMLAVLCEGMKDLDQKKSREMLRSMDQREAMIGREAIAEIEEALVLGDQSVSRAEYDYCAKNPAALKISSDKLDRLSQKILAQAEAIKAKGPLNEEFSIAASFLSHNKISIVRKSVEEIQGKLLRVENDLPKKDREIYDAKIKMLIQAATMKEDSLVSRCLAVFNAKGPDAASEYIDGVLKPCGVSPQKIGSINARILSSEARGKTVNEPPVISDLNGLSDTSQTGGKGLDIVDVRTAAKKKAMAHADSVRVLAALNERNRIAEQARSDSLKRESIREERAAAVIENEKNANASAMDIYALIGANQITQADEKFIAQRKALETYLTKEAFRQLSDMLSQARETLRAEKGQISGATVAPVSKSDDPDNRAQERYLEANREKARQVITEIYGLLENKKIDAAYKRFVRVRKPLEKYLDKEAFSMLESTVLLEYEGVDPTPP
jgi:hypothetical protein